MDFNLRRLIMKPTLILINPWIYDFAAYDMWSKPLGLLYVAGFLRECGFDIQVIDCMDVHATGMKEFSSQAHPVRRLYGTGKFWRKEIPKPAPLAHINRTYSRYGIAKQLFIQKLLKIEDPSAILVTSLMTYWYPGVREAINLAKETYPGLPVILGGAYARLCKEHAVMSSCADCVVSEGTIHDQVPLLGALKQFGIYAPKGYHSVDGTPWPAFDLLRKLDYICIATSTGCPYRCHYCGSRFLNPTFTRRKPSEVIEEIRYWNEKFGVKDFAFYDDALLVDSVSHIKIVLNGLMESGLPLRFHTPNALHVREISQEIAGLLYRSGFRTIRLGLETADIGLHNDLDRKVSDGEFERAVRNLTNAGFDSRDIGSYILMGLPGQSVESVVNTLNFVADTGTSPYLAEYSPLPHTPLWQKAIACSDYDIAAEPLFHNNSLLPCWDEEKRLQVQELKRIVREIRTAC
jgi:hypothetical protein